MNVFLGKRELADVTKVKDLHMERVLWILQVGPIQSPESLKQITSLTGVGEGQRDCCMRRLGAPWLL